MLRSRAVAHAPALVSTETVGPIVADATARIGADLEPALISCPANRLVLDALAQQGLAEHYRGLTESVGGQIPRQRAKRVTARRTSWRRPSARLRCHRGGSAAAAPTGMPKVSAGFRGWSAGDAHEKSRPGRSGDLRGVGS